MPPAARSVEELFPLIEFCKNGDLKAVSDWIAKGNPLDLPPGKKPRRASPLQIAIEKGFLTLTEILLDGGADPASNGNALWIAVRAKRIDIVRLLLGERPIVKRNDIKAYGRYRTMETILQIYDAWKRRHERACLTKLVWIRRQPIPRSAMRRSQSLRLGF